MSEENIALIVDHVSLLRGAAVKLAQKLNLMPLTLTLTLILTLPPTR